MSWALDLGNMNIILEMDSMRTVNWMHKKTTCKWRICKQMNRLRALIDQVKEIKSTHIFREAYWVADAL